MPKSSKFPKLRTYIKRGRGGQVWTSFAYDMRGTGKPDIPLGNDYADALRQWDELHNNAPRMAGTLEEAFRAWELDDADGLLSPKLKPNTVKGYTACLRAMRPPLGGARWDEVTLPELAAYVRKRSAKSRARQEMQLLSVIWGYARLAGFTALHYPAKDMQRTGWKGLSGVRAITVTDDAFAVLHRHADQTLKDALDVMTATGMRVEDVLRLPLSDSLAFNAGKTGKAADFDVAASVVLPPIIARRKAMRGPEHLFLIAAGKKPVTYRMLADRFTKARAAAAQELPECASLFLRDMRKRASNLAGSLKEASELLQHSSESVTRKHYRTTVEKLKPVR